MRILVTGAAGFIGGHVTDKLHALGHDILAIDNLSFGRLENVSQGAEFQQLDMSSIENEDFSKCIVSYNPQSVVHLAAIHFIPYCMAHPNETFASNVRATELLIRTLLRCPSVNKLVSASTMDVYAPNDTVHIESDDPSPRNSYGLSKLLTEQITRFAVDNSEHLSAVCLRFANVYGPRETNAHLIPDALERITSVVESEIRMGYLGGARDFVHVFDIVDAIVTCLFQDTGSYEIFNVGSGVSTPVRKIVEIIRDAFGDDRPIVEDANKLRSFDRKSLTPDITRIQQRTSWRPRIVIEDGLKSLVEESLNVSVNF